MSTASLTFDERYRAIDARDARFDGQFVTAVRSTGIYCRPSCPARTPKPENVTFYPTSAAAHEAGYRACKRCLPEAAPGSPAWNLRGDVAGRAMRLIADGVVEREGVPGLAARLGYSSRHLTRLLTEELGAGPLALARAQRAHTARMLLVSTDLSASDVAFSAGFTSVRQFNDTISEVFGMAPLALRARRRGDAALPAPGAIDLVLPHRGPLDVAGLFAWMAARAVAGAEVGAATSFARTVRLPGGPAWFELRTDDAGRVRLRAKLTQLGDLPVLVARARRLFDLDADPLAVDAALSTHPELAPLVARVPGIRVPGAVDPHERLDWTTITPFADMALPELTTVPFAPNSQSSMPYAWAEVEPGATTAADSASTDAARQSTLLLGSQAFRRLSLESLELLSTDQKANADKDERETTEVLNGPFGNTVYSGWISHQSRMQIEL